MSTIKGIFEPFRDYVQDQLNIRKSIMRGKNVGLGVLPQLFGAYTSKQCTVRMASGVDIIKENEDEISPLFDDNNWERTLHGDNLARAYVLESGIRDLEKETRVLTKEEEEEVERQNAERAKQPPLKDYYHPNFENANKPFVTSTGAYWDSRVPGRIVHDQGTLTGLLAGALDGKSAFSITRLTEVKIEQYKNEFMKTTRGGIGQNGAYGDPKVRGNFDGDYGLVPMPGITDVTVRTKSDDGSLREAQVNYFCHNRKQLEILETLYMRPGYPVLLEWGWNPFISNDRTIEESYDVLDAFFDPDEDLHSLNKQITQRKIDSGGNYDGFIGNIKNFSFKATGTGGFECTTEIIAHGEILESLKSAQVVLPVPPGERRSGQSSTEAEPSDQFLYLLKSMKANLDKAGDQKYIAVKDSAGDEYTNWEKTTTYFGNIWKYGILSNAWSTGVQERVFDEDFDADTHSEQIKTYTTPDLYQKGFSLVLDTIKEIMKASDKEIAEEKKVNSRQRDYGFDSFLYGTFLQEIAMTEDVDQTNNENITGKDKNIFVRWDLLCQLINRYVIPSYKEKSKPLVELTYLNPNAQVVDYDVVDKKIEKGEENNETDKFYLDYALPSTNKIHPKVKDEDLKKILGQSFDYGVCIMPHQFDDSLIVSKYDSNYESPNTTIPEVETTTNEEGTEVFQGLPEKNPNYVDYSQSPTGQPSQQYIDMTNTGYYAVTPEEYATFQYDKDGNRVYESDAEDKTGNYGSDLDQTAQNEGENYQPLTSYEGVKFSNQSIGLVYFNLDYLLSTYENMATEKKEGKNGTETRLKDKFDFFTFIDKIWGKVNEVCAGYYDFSLQTEHDRPFVARIIDRTPAGSISSDSDQYNKIFQFEPQGLDSQLRDFFFSSKISSEIADTISIAAQSPNNAKSLDALSFKAFHKNIRNRFTTDSLDFKLSEAELAKEKLEGLLAEYENKLSILKTYQKRNNAHYRAEVESDNSYVANVDSSTAISLAKSIEELCVQINSRYPMKDADGKSHPKAGMINKEATNDRNAIIPLEFSLQMDGISGISPLNLFKINKDRLPYGYQRDDIAFIVKGEEQKITAGQDWTIELDGQLTLLNTNTKDEGSNLDWTDPQPEASGSATDQLNKEDKNNEEPPVPDGEDPSPIINSDKVGATSSANSPLAKQSGFFVGKGTIESDFKAIKPYIDNGTLTLVGDGNTNSKFTTYLTTNKLLGGKHYLHKSCAPKFKSWMADLDSQGIDYVITSTIRWGKNAGGGPHGYGLAVDFGNLNSEVGGKTDPASNLEARKNSATYEKIAKSGKKFGFYNPWRLADNGGTMDELWHFEYWGEPV